ncbi:MAG: dienelactone hydrolase family protein [Magnetospirillum sp.]|nr:dienelactone hydrolase family protein [Magnetospirillum sp.]
MAEIDSVRRSLLAGLAGVPLAAILADPVLAQAAAQTTRSQTITTPAGREVTAALARPDKPEGRLPVVMLIHEWWGLNDQIKAMAVELSRQGFLAVAVDLFQGRVVTDAEEARALVEKVNPEEAADTLAAWAQWARNHPDGNRRLGVVGWCFGGGWALNAATIAPIDATVVYYGRVNLPPDRLARLRGPVLAHFARQDQFINAQVVADFERAMKEVGKPYTLYWYDAGHAFANPTGNNYRRADARLAWQRTVEFLRKELG